MPDADAATQVPAWALRTILATALALFAAAALLVWLPGAAVPGAGLGWAMPVALHCVLNGAAYYVVWRLHRPGADASGLAAATVAFLAYGFGAVDTFLAGAAALDFSLKMAPALLFAVPAAVGWLILSLDDLAKGQTEIPDDVALEEPEDLPVKTAAWAQGIAVVYSMIWIAVFVFGFAAGTMWFYIVWYAIRDHQVFSLWQIGSLMADAIGTNWIYALSLTAVFGAIVAIFGAFAVLRGPVKRLWRRLGHGLTDEQRQLVEERLRALWDYANRTEDRKGAWVAILLLPLAVFGVIFGGSFVLLIYADHAAFWLYRQMHALPPGWHLFEVSTAGFVFVIAASLMIAWSVTRLIVDRWPFGLEVAITAGLRRGVGQQGSEVGQTRRRLKALVRSGRMKAGQPFDPRQHLLNERRRASRWLHGFALLAALVAVYAAWASMNNYTLITPDGIRDANGLTGTVQAYRFADVERVRLQCTLDIKGDTHFGYEAWLRDGQEIPLFHEKDLSDNLPVLLRIDAILRSQTTKFVTADPATGKAAVEPECVDGISEDIPDKAGVRRLLHQS